MLWLRRTLGGLLLFVGWILIHGGWKEGQPNRLVFGIVLVAVAVLINWGANDPDDGSEIDIDWD
jgi:hypothetical protein